MIVANHNPTRAERFDALVVGAGPAGSAAALVLARGGARVALVDKVSFPRDKACGDLIGPRGVQVLSDLDIPVPGARAVGDMIVVGPNGWPVRLPALPGHTYPRRALAVPRDRFDAMLRDAAIDAGAMAFVGRAAQPLSGDGGLEGFTLSTGVELRADVVVGADGAASGVANAAGLVDERRALWGFALRAYTEASVAAPHIVFWEPTRGCALPGYGWIFPGPSGSNLGLGIGMLSTRNAASTVTRQLPAFVGHLRELELVEDAALSRPLGGWLKLGMIGTDPARGRVLLVGDAAGLVNPLQGEGIGPALASGRAAAEAVLGGPPRAAIAYKSFLRTTYASYMATAASAHASLLGRPRAISILGRALTAPVVSRGIAGAWSIFWNDLLAGAIARPSVAIAATVAKAGDVAAARSRTGRWFTSTFRDVADDEAEAAVPTAT